MTLVEAIHQAEQRGVTALASADWSRQASMRVTAPADLARTVERANAALGAGAEPPKAYVVGDDGTIYNTVTRRAEYVAAGEREVPKPGVGTAPATLGSLTGVTPSTAPREINLSAFNSVYTTEWGRSFPAGIAGTCYERGATITSDATGALRVANEGDGLSPASGSFRPDLSVPAGQTVRGVIHTHPYSYADGYSASNPPPKDVATSGGDAAYLINTGQTVIIAVGSSSQSMYLRTTATPAHVDFNAVNNTFNAEVGVKMAGGMTFEQACRAQAIETANRYGLVYYEGKNGQFTRQN